VGQAPRIVIAAAAAVILGAAPAMAAPAVDGVFDIPGDAGVQTNGQLTLGPDGNVWVALDQAVAFVKSNGTVVPLASGDLGNALGSPFGGITSAAGFIWVSQPPVGGKKAIVKIPPADHASATGVDVTDIDAGATAMTTGPDGFIWVGLTGKLVRFSPLDPAISTTFPVTNLAPKAITSASDGTLWVTDTNNGGRLLNVTTAGVVTPYTVGGQPQFVGAGPNAQIAFGNPNSMPQQIGLLSPGGSPQLLDRPNGSDPFGVTFGADGAYWVAEFAGNRLARVTTDGQLTTLGGFPVVAGQGPRQIVAGPDKTLWVTLDKPGDAPNSKIARVSGVETPPVTNPNPSPGGGDTPPGDQTPATTPPPPDKTPPVISNVTLSKTGTTVVLRLTLSEPATLRARLYRLAPGKRLGKRCVRPTPRLRRARLCTRVVSVRTVSANGIAGQNAIRTSIRRLPPGRYRLVLTAVDAAGNAGAPVARSFSKR
jgi:streptogramin lyase